MTKIWFRAVLESSQKKWRGKKMFDHLRNRGRGKWGGVWVSFFSECFIQSHFLYGAIKYGHNLNHNLKSIHIQCQSSFGNLVRGELCLWKCGVGVGVSQEPPAIGALDVWNFAHSPGPLASGIARPSRNIIARSYS